MNGNSAAEAAIGTVVVLSAAAFLLYTAQATGFRGSPDTYPLEASFRSVEGISAGTDVRLAGIKVGTVGNLALDPERFEARVTMNIDRALQIPEDSDVRVTQEGLLGGSFLEITPGASDFMLSAGDEILNTQSSVSLLNLLLRFGMGE